MGNFNTSKRSAIVSETVPVSDTVPLTIVLILTLTVKTAVWDWSELRSVPRGLA